MVNLVSDLGSLENSGFFRAVGRGHNRLDKSSYSEIRQSAGTDRNLASLFKAQTNPSISKDAKVKNAPIFFWKDPVGEIAKQGRDLAITEKFFFENFTGANYDLSRSFSPSTSPFERTAARICERAFWSSMLQIYDFQLADDAKLAGILPYYMRSALETFASANRKGEYSRSQAVNNPDQKVLETTLQLSPTHLYDSISDHGQMSRTQKSMCDFASKTFWDEYLTLSQNGHVTIDKSELLGLFRKTVAQVRDRTLKSVGKVSDSVDLDVLEKEIKNNSPIALSDDDEDPVTLDSEILTIGP